MTAPSIAAVLARAKAATAPAVIVADTRIALTRRVRSVDYAGAGGFIVDDNVDGWVFWLGDDGSSHLSRPDFLESETP